GVTSLSPPELPESLSERRDMGLYFQVALGIAHQHADPPHSIRLLCPRRQWPRRSRAAEQREELTALHVEHRFPGAGPRRNCKDGGRAVHFTCETPECAAM